LYKYFYSNADYTAALIKKKRKLDLNSDIDLMLKVQKGETAYLGILFERYKLQLFGFFFRTTGNKAASEDMVQNVFLRILKYKDKFSGYGKFTSWMYQIARNVNYDYFKINSRYHISDEMDFADEENSNAEQTLIRKENTKMLNTAMMRLSAEKREVLVLSRYQNLKYKEIAEILDCSEGNVKIKVFRALSDLRQIYSQLEA